MKILGIHEGHNASATLFIDGAIKYSIQEERLTGIKNYWAFPKKSINKILSLCKLTINDIDSIALAANHTPIPSDVLEQYRKSSNLFISFIKNLLIYTPLYSQYKKKIKQERINRLTQLGISADKIFFVEHHLCHASYAYYSSPWKNDKVLVFTCDGSGDGLCATVSIGEEGRLHRIAKTKKGHSIGNIYSQITFMLGLIPWEHEWKIMGLAPYASEKDVNKSYAIIKKYLEVDGLVFKRKTFEPTHMLYKRLRKELEFHRFDWIAGAIQKLSEELLVKWVKNAIKETGIHKVAFAGGVFMNVKANKLIMELDEVEEIFIAPSCGDESNSIGAAYQVYAQIQSRKNQPVKIAALENIYFGPEYSNHEIKTLLEKKSFNFKYIDNINKKTAELLSSGHIIARCSGRMEFGARALGNRSILADPANQDCIRIINMMIKKRDFWMPFAPVILDRRQDDYIVNPKQSKNPYMMLSYDTTSKRTEFIGGVQQADLTARAQIIEQKHNPGYYSVLEEFEKITGQGILLNTSFNLHGYPLVNTPEDALWVFENSGLKYLALGNYLVSK